MTGTLTAPPPDSKRRIDPRIRQRRIEVKRDEGRRRLRVLVAGVGLLAAVVLGLLAANSPLLSVRHVRITGAGHTNPADILRAASLTGHPVMIDVNGGAAARAIDRLPWVASARVHRAWPGTVAVTVVERVPVATAGGWLVDSVGRVLAPAGSSTFPPVMTDPAIRVVPVGAAGSTIDPAYRPALAVSAALPAGLLGRVTGVAVNVDGTVGLHLGRGSAQLGTPSDALAEKLQAVETMLDKVNVGTGIIDVTVASAPLLLGG